MLLSNYKQVLEIEKDIDKRQKELIKLYNSRRALLSKVNTASSPKADTIWEETQYTRMAADWLELGIKIPAYRTLAKKLLKAKQTLQRLQEQNAGEFSLLLMPPTSKVDLTDPIITKAGIFVGESLNYLNNDEASWKLYVVSGQTLAATPEIAKNGITIGDYHLPGLNLREYAVYLATHKTTVDHDSWSVLPRDLDATTKLIPCVTFMAGSYKFDVDLYDTLLGENHFRPAMEMEG